MISSSVTVESPYRNTVHLKIVQIFWNGVVLQFVSFCLQHSALEKIVNFGVGNS